VVQSGDGDGLERLARYLARPPVSLQRMEWDREKGEVLYRTARGHAEERGGEEDRSDDVERIDELEFLARVVTQLPEPRKHSTRYSGYYAAVVRARRRQANAEAEASMSAAGNDAVGNVASEARGNVGGVHSAVAVRSAVCSEPDTTERKLLRKRWAELIRRVYEIDPLLSRVRRDHADRRDHHREERHHEDPPTHLAKSAAATATEGSGPGPYISFPVTTMAAEEIMSDAFFGAFVLAFIILLHAALRRRSLLRAR